MRVAIRWTVSAALLTLTTGAGLLASSQVAQAQEADEMGARTMARFVGDWTFDEIDGEPASGHASCRLLGEYIVVCTSSVTNDDGTESEALFSNRYDPVEDTYWGYRFYDNGYADRGRGWVEGDVLTFIYPLPNGDLARFSGTFTSDDTWEFAWHSSQQGGDWVAGQTGSMSRR